MKFLAFIPALLGAAYAFAAPYVSPLPDGDIAIEFPAASPKNPGPFTIERAEGRFAPYSPIATKIRAAKASKNASAVGVKYIDRNAPKAPNTYYYRLLDRNGTPLDTIGLDIDLFGDKVVVFSPADAPQAVADRIRQIDSTLFGREMSADRYTILFKQGDYRDAGLINIPFYVHAAGLGKTPYDVKIHNIHTPPHLKNDNGTCTFWRSVENLSVLGDPSYEEDEMFKWAVSQAAPIRRVHSTRTVKNQWKHGWVSGGFTADCDFRAPAGSDGQQQWFTRNSFLRDGRGRFAEGSYNFCFLGVDLGQGADRATYRDNWADGGNVTFIDSTPIVREKPFLFIGDDGRYKVFRGAWRRDSHGISYSLTDQGEGETLDLLDDFRIIRPGATAAGMNAAIAAGKNLLITPGMYELEEPLLINRPDAIVLGLGWATLIPAAANVEAAVKIGDVEGAQLASVLLDAHHSSRTLLEVGEPCEDGRNHQAQPSTFISASTSASPSASPSANPVMLSDVFFRIGGFLPSPVHVDRAVEINSDDVVADHLWIWRADHGVKGGTGWDVNTARNGLVVNGDRFTVYGLFNEHFQEYQTLWNGEDGRMYFYQCETPYDAPEQSAFMSEGGTRNGYAAYKVADHVKSHYAAALGIYDVLVRDIRLHNSAEAPDAPGVKIHHLVNTSFSGGGKKGFDHIINGLHKSTFDTHSSYVERLVDFNNGNYHFYEKP